MIDDDLNLRGFSVGVFRFSPGEPECVQITQQTKSLRLYFIPTWDVAGEEVSGSVRNLKGQQVTLSRFLLPSAFASGVLHKLPSPGSG